MFCTTHLDLAVVESEELGYVSSNDDGSFPFYVDFVIPLSPTRLLSDLTIHMSNTTGVISESENAYPSREPRFTPGLWWGSCCTSCLLSVLCGLFVFCLSSPGVLCVQCYQCLCIVHSWLPLRLSLTFIYSVSALSILDCHFSCL
jgi:hypothetical protein